VSELWGPSLDHTAETNICSPEMNHRSLAPPEESMADVHTYEDVEGTRAFGEKRPADFGQFVTA
jgi:hypothetical protein